MCNIQVTLSRPSTSSGPAYILCEQWATGAHQLVEHHVAPSVGAFSVSGSVLADWILDHVSFFSD